MVKKKAVANELQQYDLVYIKWADSYGVGSAWGETLDCKAAAHYCHSVGWIVCESKEAIVLVPHMSPKNEVLDSEEQGCGDMTIPIVAIVKRVKL